MATYRSVLWDVDPETESKSVRDIKEFDANNTDAALNMAAYFHELDYDGSTMQCELYQVAPTRETLGFIDCDNRCWLTYAEANPQTFDEAYAKFVSRVNRFERWLEVGDDMGVTADIAWSQEASEGALESIAEAIQAETGAPATELLNKRRGKK